MARQTRRTFPTADAPPAVQRFIWRAIGIRDEDLPPEPSTAMLDDFGATFPALPRSPGEDVPTLSDLIHLLATLQEVAEILPPTQRRRLRTLVTQLLD